MMWLSYLNLLTAFIIIITGIYVLAMGDWRKFKLKYAALILSTVAAIWLFVSSISLGGILICKLDEKICTTYGLYGIARNISFIIFHIAVGRDAIRFKKADRRVCLTERRDNKTIKIRRPARG